MPRPARWRGLRVLDVATLFAGPVIATLMDDLGADVIKVEHPRGDSLRTKGRHREGESLWWAVVSRNKPLHDARPRQPSAGPGAAQQKPTSLIDLRSDTVTRPTPEMRRAMADAEVGDDVYGEDPTVIALQERTAALFGREAALLCPSGVMCNQLWLRVLATPGTEVVVEADAHVVNYEGGAGALLGGVQFRTVPAFDGLLEPGAVADAIRADHFPLTPTSLVCVEQTHNRRGGTWYPLSRLAAIRGVCDDAGVGLYMDGARVFNASVASGTPLEDYGTVVDGLMCCLSKALGAPVGSVMVGDADAIAEATQWRRRYGGAMRQAGVLAAAGL
ncbi:MAG: GntG family PLP-dependent aldolase, partial [Egibacteraceae bacterium]